MRVENECRHPLDMFHSALRGYHVYKDILDVVIRKQLSCRKDCYNVHDIYTVLEAVAVV